MVYQIVRLLVLGFVATTVLYVLVSLYSRSVRREKLEKRWAEEGGQGDRRTYVEAGMEEYRTSFKRRLITLIYVVPVVAVPILIYAINFY